MYDELITNEKYKNFSIKDNISLVKNKNTFSLNINSLDLNIKSPNTKNEDTYKIEIKELPTTWRNCFKIKIFTKELISFISLRTKELYFDKSKKNKLNTKPGDCIGVIPFNSTDEILEISKFFNIKSENISINLENRNIKYEGCLYDFLKSIDLSEMPSKRFLKELFHFFDKKCDEKNKKLLNFLIQKENEDEYLKLKNYKTFDFIKYLGDSHDEILKIFLSHSVRNKPRFYSIIDTSEDYFTILVGKEEYSFNGRKVLGKFSKFCYENKNKKIESSMNLILLKSVLLPNLENLDEKENKKSLFISTGTGICSFIFSIKKNFESNFQIIYGFRNEEDNILKYLLNDFEIEKLRKENKLVEISSIKIRIPEFLRKNKENYKNEENIGNIFLCGSVNSMKSIYEALKEIKLIKNNNLFVDNWE